MNLASFLQFWAPSHGRSPATDSTSIHLKPDHWHELTILTLHVFGMQKTTGKKEDLGYSAWENGSKWLTSGTKNIQKPDQIDNNEMKLTIIIQERQEKSERVSTYLDISEIWLTINGIQEILRVSTSHGSSTLRIISEIYHVWTINCINSNSLGSLSLIQLS